MMTAVSGASDVCGCRSVVIIQSDSFRINAAEIGRFELSSRLVREERIIRKKQPTSIFFSFLKFQSATEHTVVDPNSLTRRTTKSVQPFSKSRK